MITYGTGTYAGVLTVITGDISEVQGVVQSGLTAQGYTSTRAGNLDNITTAPSASTIAGQVRTELTTELARIDVATSTRLATAGYTAPANSDITAIKAKTDNLPAQPASRGEVSVVNEGVKKASLLVPHTGNLP